MSDSAFAQVREVDILRTDGCYADGRAVECEDIDQLFPSSWCKKAKRKHNPTYIFFKKNIFQNNVLIKIFFA